MAGYKRPLYFDARTYIIIILHYMRDAPAHKRTYLQTRLSNFQTISPIGMHYKIAIYENLSRLNSPNCLPIVCQPFIIFVC